MATHSSVLAWKIPGTGEPGGLPSLGSRRIGHDWSDLAAAAAAVNFMTRACHDPICRKSQGIHSDIAKTKRQVLQSHRTQTSTKQLWRHETRRRLLPGQKAMTNLDSVLKSRDITLPTKVHIVKAMVFPVVVRIGPYKRQNAKELMTLNCGAGEDSWKSLGLQEDQISQS